VSKADIDKRYLDKPYDITPGGKIGADAFAVIRDAMEDQLVQKDHTNPISSHT
jgi:non-homologous end joining protein Ku